MRNIIANAKAALCWTGGKDSALAYYDASQQGYDIVLLVTFVPEPFYEFKAHPLTHIKSQAKLMHTEHCILPIRAEHAFEDYVVSIKEIGEIQGITHLITGDIDNIDAKPNWITQCCQESNVKAVLPLWQQDRLILMERFLDLNIVFNISYINHPAIPASWLGKTFNQTLLMKMCLLCHQHKIDLCGENGEYHTMTIDAPFFETPLY
jgi:uncharacterized protein (TIGR00290 family)